MIKEIIAILLLILSVYILSGFEYFDGRYAHGQDFDACFIDNDMYKRICDQKEINKIVNDSLPLAEKWFNLDCSNATNFDECDLREDEK